MLEAVTGRLPLVREIRSEMAYHRELKSLGRKIRNKVGVILESYDASSVDIPTAPEALVGAENLHGLFPETTTKKVSSIEISTPYSKRLSNCRMIVSFVDGSWVLFTMVGYVSVSNAWLNSESGVSVEKTDDKKGSQGMIDRLNAIDELVSAAYDKRFPYTGSGVCY